MRPLTLTPHEARAAEAGRLSMIWRAVWPTMQIHDGYLNRWGGTRGADSIPCPFKPGDVLTVNGLSIRIDAMEVRRVQSVTEAEAEACGITMDSGAPTAVDGFAHAWSRANRRAGLAWECDPWCWAVRVTVAKGVAK